MKIYLELITRLIDRQKPENMSSGFPTMSDTYQAVKPQKMDRGLKFRI